MYDWRSRGSCLLPGKNPTGCADTVSAVFGIRLPPECRFRWDCKRRKRFNAGVPGAVAPGKTNLWSPPLPVGKGAGGYPSPSGKGGRKEREGSVGRRQRKHALHGGTCTAVTTSAASSLMPGCRGRSPRQNQLKISPFPGGEGGWGMGEKEKGQGGGGGRQSRQAPQRIPERHSHPATTRASSPQGATVARSANAARAQARGMQGAKPLA